MKNKVTGGRICTDDPYEVLAGTIIQQACADYISALVTLKRNPKDGNSQIDRYECESFFKSEYFTLLAHDGLDGEALMLRCRAKAEERYATKCEKSKPKLHLLLASNGTFGRKAA